jgi:hypothetical protein
MLMSIIRRYVPYGDILRTNFIITANGMQVGTFIRKFTLTDKYIMDLTADYQKAIDRRVAIALAVLLDAGEQR